MQESARRTPRGSANLRIESLSFADIPGQSKLFLDHLSGSELISGFYPSRRSIISAGERVEEVIAAYPDHRAEVCDVLAEQNGRFGAGAMTHANIERLRDGRTVAVLTGQQAGFMGGPLYTVYKAMSAVRLAEDLSQKGVPAVPIFWAATEDHDFEEISTSFDIDASGKLIGVHIETDEAASGMPVGSIKVPAGADEAIRDHFDQLEATEFSPSAREIFLNAWTPGIGFGEAFCRFIASLFADRGLIVVDPQDHRLKRLAAPLIARAIELQPEISASLVNRGNELEAAGYHTQVLVEDDHVPVFRISDTGVRQALKAAPDGSFRVPGERRTLQREELLRSVELEPERFSAGVMLRPVVQDLLFPTICYFGGAAEIAYFAQNSEVYRLLGRPVTPIFHRQSFTVIEAKHGRTLDRYSVTLRDLFRGFDDLVAELVDKFVNPSAARLFADVEEAINIQLHLLDAELAAIDPTLAANLGTRRRKILYHIAAIQKKFHRVQGEKDETLDRRLRAAVAELFPRSALQERTVGAANYLNRHGMHFMEWLYDAADINDTGHRIIRL